MTKERPIIFSGPMVRAILDGRKMQTRRIVKPQPLSFNGRKYIVPDDSPKTWHDTNDFIAHCKYGRAGDRLWVRETFCLENTYEYHSDDLAPRDRPFQRFHRYCKDSGGEYFIIPHYRATESFEFMGDDGFPAEKWQPSIHMPRCASRILLEITAVRVERLQDISDDDCILEGIEGLKIKLENTAPKYLTPRNQFIKLWESINGFGSWHKNPWVWVIEFQHINKTALAA